MERSDTLTKVISALLFIAMLAYLGVYLIRSINDPVQTAPAVYTTVTDSASASGLVVRDEFIITSDDTHVDCSVGDGQRVAAGAVLAESYSSETALERANRVRELELEISRLKSVLPGLATSYDLSVRDSAIRSSVLDLTKAVTMHDLSELDSCCISIRALVCRDSTGSSSSSDLLAMEQELSSLRHSSTSDTSSITAERSGVFSSVVDGFEYLTPDIIKGCSPEQLRSLIRSSPEPESGAVGKIVTSYSWYYAAVVSAEDAECLTEGASASLKFGRFYDSIIPARVESISPVMGGECSVVFSCSQALADTLAMRQVSAEIVFDEYSGIRVPSEAMNFETADDGTERAFVYTLTGIQAEKKFVEIVYTAEDFYLVSSTGADALREGNEIIFGSDDIFDGKVLD